MGNQPEMIEPPVLAPPVIEPVVVLSEPEPPALDEPELIRQQMEETREQLAEKVGLLENQISGAVESVSNVLDIRKHVQDHPWLAIGVAAAAGWATGWVMGRWLFPSRSSTPQYYVGENGAVLQPAMSSPPPGAGLLGELSNIAGAALRGAAYELSARVMPMAVDALLNNSETPPPAAAPADVLPFGSQRQAE